MFFASAPDFRRWLALHSASAAPLLVGFYKRDSGRPSMTWPEAVDEALCVGWIDGVRKRIDDQAYQIRFSPRRQGSIWSAVNIERVGVLQAQGRMTEAGLQAFARRVERRSRIYAYEQDQCAELSVAEVRGFKQNPKAWAYHEALPPGYRKVMLHWITSAKRPETRERRLLRHQQACSEHKRLLP